ncbi:MAG: hypothetical protein JWM16_815 [Verrucomicrobiales bacterium]|nr:hypothetical protein [Verrucomicrobiales bacterium]
MFEEEIFCLGGGITCADKRTIETTVENRKLNLGGDNLLTIDDLPQSTDLGIDSSVSNINEPTFRAACPGRTSAITFPTAPKSKACANSAPMPGTALTSRPAPPAHA